MADPSLVERVLAVIRQHESSNNYQALNHSESPDKAASGAYQIIGSTWRGWAAQSGIPEAGTFSRAVDAPPDVQDAVARAAVTRMLDANGGNPDAVWASWYTGGYDPNHLDYVPSEFDSKGNRINTVTVRNYINQANSMLSGDGGTPISTAANPSQDPAVQSFLQAVHDNPDALVRQRFPTYALYLNDPELGPLLTQATTENWDSTRLQAAIAQTGWWTKTSDSQRTWDQLANADPASADRQKQAQLLQVSQQFAKLGFTPDQGTLWSITQDSLRNGWNAQQISAAIATALPQNYAAGAGGFGAGDISGSIQQLKASAADYFMPLDDQTAYDWAKRMQAGTMSNTAATGQLVGWAKQNYAFLAPQLDAGGTVKDYFAPLAQEVSKIMGTGASAVDVMNDPYWHQLTQITDPQGARRAPTLEDAQALARSHPDYKYTADAQNRGASTVQALTQTFNGGA